MSDLLIFIVAIILGYQLGVMVTAYKLRKFIFEHAKQQGLDLEEKESKEVNLVHDTEQLVIERENNILYLYNKEDKFVCQGSSINELAQLALKYKNIKYAEVVDKKENKVFAFVNGEVLANES